jgi:endoglucanase
MADKRNNPLPYLNGSPGVSMQSILRSALLTLTVTLAVMCALPARADDPPPNPRPTVSEFTPISAADQVRQMGRGTNIMYNDPFWKDNRQGRYRDEHFARIKAVGFDTVRVPIVTFPFLDQDNRLDPKFLNRLDWVVATSRKHNLNAIIDVHEYLECEKDFATCRMKLKAVWEQLAERYRNEPNTVIFEMMNEPHGQFDVARWNAAVAELLPIIRKTNPERNVIIGGAKSNNRDALRELMLPVSDRHIIATFHYYVPFAFTHQGASWVTEKVRSARDVPFGTPEEIAQVDADFARVNAWSESTGRPVFVGEFGSIDKAPMEYRAIYVRTVARAAEKYGFAWAHWEFSTGFTLYDFRTQRFIPLLLEALVPETK